MLRRSPSLRWCEVFAGRDLDIEVACTLWRCTVVIDHETGPAMMGDGELEPIPHYSTDITDAHLVIDLMKDAGWSFRSKRDKKIGYIASFSKNDGTTYRFFRTDTLPLSICVAALAVFNGTGIQKPPG